MRFGIIGLGHMGGNVARRAIEQGHQVVGYNRTPERARNLAREGLEPAYSLDELVRKLESPRLVLIYVPHGAATQETVAELQDRLGESDIVADGGNSHWQDSVRHYGELKAKGIAFLDVGTSGGLEGARRGACFMVGGDADAFTKAEPLLRDLAVPDGVLHVGPVGAGHFVKLVHNAIEFGMVQAIAEGLDLLVRSDYPLDLPAVMHNWNHGSVIRGWLIELMEQGLRERKLDELRGRVEDTREVKWAIQYALEKEAWVPVIAQSELGLYRYRDPDSVAGKAVALLRHGFGGHPLEKKCSAAPVSALLCQRARKNRRRWPNSGRLEPDRLSQEEPMQVKDIMTEDVACCTPDTELQEVAHLMAERDCGAIPVVEDKESRRPVGIVTDRDIVCRTVAQGQNPLELTAGDCMTESCTTVTPETDVEDCCRTLEQQQIRRAPVVDEDGGCCGMVAQADIARHAGQDATAEVVQQVSQPAGASSAAR